MSSIATPTPPFTVEHEEFRRAVRGWIARELRPHADEWEAERWFPDEVFRWCADQGYLGLKFPVAYGGDDDVLADAVFIEELSRCGSGGLAGGLGGHTGIALPPVATFGTEEQKQRYLVPGIRGEKIGALAITEPDAGSDVAAIKTSARRVDGGWTVNGSKAFITNGCRAHFAVTAVKTSTADGHAGISLVIIDTDQPGYNASKTQKLGYHASDTAVISLQDVFVPESNLLGAENEGFRLIMANFEWERLAFALSALGLMQDAFERTLRYATERVAFGRPIGRHQAIRHKLADLATAIYTGRCITYDALRRHAAGEHALQHVTMAKLVAARTAYEIVDACLQIHGGAGYMKEYEIERMARDARLGPIAGGTDEIMREIIGKALGL